MIDISSKRQVALLIDADNVQPNYLEHVLRISDYYGVLSERRAYGDWTKLPLSSWCEKIDALQVERVQVNRVGKNATDHRLLIEAGEILGNQDYHIEVFIIVSGDGDFASACELIRERGGQVVGIANKASASKGLQQLCHQFHYIEDLADELSELEKRYPIPPNEVRAFSWPLLHAYHQLAQKNYWVWVNCAQLGTKLRELYPNYKSKFGKYQLSEWLKNFDKDFEVCEQRIRRIDQNPKQTRFEKLLAAYTQTKGPDGLAPLGQLGQALRASDSDYERYFGGKELSEWIEDYPNTFTIHENCVIGRINWLTRMFMMDIPD